MEGVIDFWPKSDTGRFESYKVWNQGYFDTFVQSGIRTTRSRCPRTLVRLARRVAYSEVARSSTGKELTYSPGRTPREPPGTPFYPSTTSASVCQESIV
jgi:hypothetical protein